MKYSRAAAILLTSSAAVSTEAFETRNHAHDVVNTMRMPMMYGYYIGCVAFGQNDKDQLPVKAHNMNDKAVAVVYDVTNQSPASMNVFNVNPPSFDTSSAAEYHTNHTNHSTKNLHFIHQMNLLMISRSMHNKEQPFIQGPLALGLFLLALLVGLAWRKDREEDQKTDGTEIKMHHELDLISKRLYNNDFDFDEIGLTSTNDDDDDDEEEEQEEQEENEDDITSVVSVANTDYQQHVSSLIKKEVVITEKKEENKVVKPILKNVTNVKSIMVGSTSGLKHISALPKAKKKVTFHDIHQNDEVTIASSVTKSSRKYFRLKHFRIHSCRKGEE